MGFPGQSSDCGTGHDLSSRPDFTDFKAIFRTCLPSLQRCDQCALTEWKGQDEPAVADNREQIINPLTSYQAIHIMEGVVERGTAQKLKVLQRTIAGKTGTTNDEKDAWFIGFTPDLVVGVYMGFDNPAPLGHGEIGGNVSAPVVRDFFKLALADQPPIPFRVPSDIRLVRVNLKTGLPTGTNDPKAILEAFKPNEGQRMKGWVMRPLLANRKALPKL